MMQCGYWDDFDRMVAISKKIPGVAVTIGTLELFKNRNCICKRCEKTRKVHELFKNNWVGLENDN